MVNLSKKNLLALVLGVIIVFGGTSVSAAEKNTKAASGKKIKNVIVMIPDGMSVGGYSLARWYQGGQPLAMDELACGLVKTYNADTPIGDSAPAGTAFATGYKSKTGHIAVLPPKAGMPGVSEPSEPLKPVVTVLEAAKLAGKSTGLIATSQIPHATPADYSSHGTDRNAYEVLIEQQVYNNVDVVLGSGSKYLQNRKDGEDLVAALKNRGYEYITQKDEMAVIKGTKVWGMFAPDAAPYDIDRTVEPSLAEMTEKAIELLSKNEKGFFIMIEGSKIDWAAHANDPIGLITDILAFDKAVKTALDFAKKDGNTVVIVVSDHGNGGVTMGDKSTSKDYDKQPLTKFMEPIKRAKLTGEGLETKFDKDKTNIKEVMAEYYGISDLSDAEIQTIKTAQPGYMNYAVGPMISSRAAIGWTTNGHTGEDVVLYVYDPTGNRPTGVVDNTDIGKYTAQSLGVDLEKLNKELFINIMPILDEKEDLVYELASTSDETLAMRKQLRETSDPKVAADLEKKILKLEAVIAANPTLIIEKGNKKIKIFDNKDYYEVNGKNIKSKAVAVFVNGGQFYVSKEIIDLVK